MSVIQSIIDSHSINKSQWACCACGSDRYWRSVYGGRQCWLCHPPPALSMVVASNLPDQPSQVNDQDVGWVECTDGQYRDYFVDGGRMWLVDEGPEYVRFSLVR